MHGSETSVDFFGEKIDGYLLADIIRNCKDYVNGTKIRLFSCSTGMTKTTGDCVAQIVADELEAQVLAPTKLLYVLPINRRNQEKKNIFQFPKVQEKLNQLEKY